VINDHTRACGKAEIPFRPETIDHGWAHRPHHCKRDSILHAQRDQPAAATSHCSYISQVLGVGVFATLKCALGSANDTILPLVTDRITLVEWLEMYVCVRSKALTSHPTLNGWRDAGLVLLSPVMCWTSRQHRQAWPLHCRIHLHSRPT
jgi:hypothetical protein